MSFPVLRSDTIKASSEVKTHAMYPPPPQINPKECAQCFSVKCVYAPLHVSAFMFKAK